MRKPINTLLALFLFCAGCAQPPAPGEEELPAKTPKQEENTEEETTEVSHEEPLLYVSLKEENSWESESRTFTQYSLSVENKEAQSVTDWEFVLNVPEDSKLEQCWNVTIKEDDAEWHLSSVDYNKEIPSQGSLKDIGFIVSSSGDKLSFKEASFTMQDQSLLTLAEERSVPFETPAVNEEPMEEVTISENAAGPLHVEGTYLKDADGNVVQLRGVSTHGLAWFPEFLNAEAVHTLHEDWHANVLRLAMYTAEYGGYCNGGDRDALLKKIDEGVRFTKAEGMYVIIDWHILSDANPHQNEEEAAQFFEMVSKKYADETHILYEICNEPQNSPFTEVIKPYAERMIDIIHKNDPDAVILVGTNTWSQDVDEVIGNQIDKDNIMYSLHFYAGTHKDDLRNKCQQAIDNGVPVFISECSITDASGNGAIDYDSAQAWLDLIQNNHLSFIGWSLSNKDESSAMIKSSCPKTSGWSEEELSDAGRWFYSVIRQSSYAN